MSDLSVGIVTEIASEKKHSKAEKRLEKLISLKEKYEKAYAVQTTATKKAEDIYAQIEKIESEIHAEEIAEVDRICEDKGMSYTDIADFLKGIPDGMTAEDVKAIFR